MSDATQCQYWHSVQYEIGKFACECPVVIFVIAVGLRTIFKAKL